jgi:hypothetical protein
MGYVNVQVGGSFVGQYGMQSVTEQFSALENGHADAVARAIQYLAEVVLPRATALDHDLHDDGARPDGGFTPSRITREARTR